MKDHIPNLKIVILLVATLGSSSLVDAQTIIDQTDPISVSDGPVTLDDLKIEPATKYTLTIEAGFEGTAESIEENSRFAILNQPGKFNPLLPSHEIKFFDAANKPVGTSLRFGHPFRNTRLYTNIFYSPQSAASARIILKSGSESLLKVTRISFAKTPDEKALNSNPGFQLGKHNYSGWKNIASGGELIEQNGNAVLDTKYGSTGEMIPLTESGTYGFSALATPNGHNSTVIIRVYDADGKELMRSATRKYGPLTYFVPPKEAVAASFLVYSCLLEEVRLIRVGDEDAIKEFL